MIPFAMAYDRVHECLTSVLCRFLIYEVFVHAADTQRSKLMHLLDMHPIDMPANMLIEWPIGVTEPSTF